MPAFCSSCGSAVGKPAPATCPQCAAEHWANPKPCGAALVTQAGRLLLVRRAHQPWLDHWDIPGGFCEGGEHPAEAAERETFEETGLRVETTAFLGMWIDDYGDELDGGDPMVTLNVYYLAEPLGDSALASDASEIAEVRWFAPDEVPSKLAFQGHIPEVLAAWRAVVSEPPA